MGKYSIDIFDCVETLRTPVWTYGQLAEKYDFCSTEVLLIDAEGHDTRIVNSVIEHCKEKETQGKWAWPSIIVFETSGICDFALSDGAESGAIKRLEECGYFIFLTHWQNTNMIHRDTLEGCARLQEWLDLMHCSVCKIKHSAAGRRLVAKTGGLYCATCKQPADPWYNYDFDF